MINKQEIKERVQKLIEAGVKVEVVEFTYKEGITGGCHHVSLGVFNPNPKPEKPKTLFIDKNATDGETIKRIEKCENELEAYLKYVNLSGKTLARFIWDEVVNGDKSQSPLNGLPKGSVYFRNENDAYNLNMFIAGDSRNCTIEPEHRDVIMINCQDLKSTGSGQIWFHNQLIGEFKRKPL